VSHPSGGRLAELTRSAVVRASALTGRVGDTASGPTDLAALLYRAGGCVPDSRLDPRWARHVVTAAERTARAGLGAYARTTGQHWHSWTATGTDPATLVHKIYVSPAVCDLSATLGVILTHAPLLGVPAWKVGADLAGLHRPDKIVLYLASAERADRVAATLALALGSLAAQGVPFSGQVGATGIVSRGRDVDGTSWRASVCRQVAESLRAARAELGEQARAAEVADLALARLSDGGLDVKTWHPGHGTEGGSRTAPMELIRRAAVSGAPASHAPTALPARRPRAEVSCA
jgi:hypothetical protein